MTEKKESVQYLFHFCFWKEAGECIVLHNDGEVFSKQLVSKESIKQYFYDEYLKAADSDELNSETDIYGSHFREILEYSRNSWKQ